MSRSCGCIHSLVWRIDRYRGNWINAVQVQMLRKASHAVVFDNGEENAIKLKIWFDTVRFSPGRYDMVWVRWCHAGRRTCSGSRTNPTIPDIVEIYAIDLIDSIWFDYQRRGTDERKLGPLLFFSVLFSLEINAVAMSPIVRQETPERELSNRQATLMLDIPETDEMTARKPPVELLKMHKNA